MSVIPGAKPFEAPEATAEEAYETQLPSMGSRAQAHLEEAPTNPTAKFSVSRFAAESQYSDTAWGAFGRALSTNIDENGLLPREDQPDTLSLKPSTTLSPEDANERYSPVGADGKQERLFDQPVPEPIAKMRGEARKAQIEREGIFRRAEASGNPVANFALSMSGMLDPLNAATMLIPGLGEEAILARLGTGFMARTGARVAAGASAGATGMAALGTLNYGLSQTEQGDFGIRDFMSDVAMGAAFGAIIHGGVVGPYREFRYRGSGGRPPPPAPPGEPPPLNGEVLPPEGPGGPGRGPRARTVTDVPEDQDALPAPPRRALPAPEGEGAVPRETQPGLETSFRDDLKDEMSRLRESHGAAQRRTADVRDEAAQNVFKKDVGPLLAPKIEGLGLTAEDTEGLWQHYDREAGEHPKQALDRALDGFFVHEERAALSDPALDSHYTDELEVLRRHFWEETHQVYSGQGGFRGGDKPGDFGPAASGRDAMTRRGEPPEVEPDIPFEVSHADAVTKHAAISSAVSQLLDERPVDVQPVFDKKANPADVARKQTQIYRNGFAQGMPQAEFDAVNEAVYNPREETNGKSEGGKTAGAGRAGAEGGAGKPGGGAAARPGGAGHEGGGEVRRAGEPDGAAAAEAGGTAGERASEPGAEGKPQQLIPGVEPITDRERAEMGMDKPLKGGEAPPPEGGLFDEGARAQKDMFDQVAKADPDLALALKELEGKDLHPEDVAEIEAATKGVEDAEKMEDAFEQAATCITEAGG